MAHKKGQGSSRNGRESESKRLGVKLFGGQTAIPGNILVRQRGTRFHAGLGVGMGKDHTLFAKEVGLVTFTTKKGNRRFISVLPVDEYAVVKDVAERKVVKETIAVATEAKAETVKAEVPKEAAPKAKKTSKGGDLKKLNGVGPAFEKRLNALGIFTFADFIALTDARIEELEKQDSMTSLEEWHNWIVQAKEFNA
jgi:large subunit ribosomal protein L27